MTNFERTRVEDARVKYLEVLYLLDGRDKREHPLCKRYTGLVAKYGGLGL